MSNPTFDLCQHVLCLVVDAMTDPPPNRFVSIENPPDDCCDFVAVWPTSITLVDPFPLPAGTENCGAHSNSVGFSVKLMRQCWPTVGTSQYDVFPSYEDVQSAAERLMCDANEIQCALTQAHLARDLTPWAGRSSTLEPAQPTVPTGGCSGWLFGGTADVPLCCD